MTVRGIADRGEGCAVGACAGEADVVGIAVPWVRSGGRIAREPLPWALRRFSEGMGLNVEELAKHSQRSKHGESVSAVPCPLRLAPQVRDARP